MIKDVQIDPITDEVLHADLIQIAMDKAIRVAVPIELVGEAVGVKTEGGFIDFMTRELTIECLPARHPGELHRRHHASSTSTSRSRSPTSPCPRASS